MGFTLKVDGPEVIEVGIDRILSVKFDMDTPNDCNARSTDVGVGMTIRGKVLTALDGAAIDSSINIAKWSLVPAEDITCYRSAQVEVINASQMVRKYTLPHAFVVDYTEEYGNDEGVGEFTLVLRQKKDKTEHVKVEGGYSL